MNDDQSKYLRLILDKIQHLDEQVSQSFVRRDRDIDKRLAKMNNTLHKVQRSVRWTDLERKQMLRELRHTERMMMALSGFHEALTVTDTENQYLAQVCESLVRNGEYALVWVGLIDPHSDVVQAVACAGKGRDYLQGLTITYSEGATGNGPTGRAIRSRRSQMSRNIAEDPAFLPWQEKAIAKNLASSVAIPLLYQEEIFGALMLYSREIDHFNNEKTAMLERMVAHVSFGIHSLRSTRLRQEEEVRMQHFTESRAAIAALLEISLKPITLHMQLKSALETILAISWLSIVAKGSIFLTEAESQLLVLEVEHQLSPPLLELCKTVPFGYCLCGRAAQQRKIVFSPCLDDQHEVTFPGIQPHGHYCVPIFSKDRLLGVLNLYVSHGHIPNPEEDEFFTTIANTLAGIIERKMIEEETLRLARYDALTGIFNRRTFYEYLHHAMAVAQREKHSLAVMFLDLDLFKQVNDQHGHSAGDELLRQTTARITATVRKTDIMARFGGDEFCILLTTFTSTEDLLGVGLKIVHSLGQEFDISGVQCRIGVSIGIALYPDHSNNAEELLNLADKALYAVKAAGRNQVFVYSASRM